MRTTGIFLFTVGLVALFGGAALFIVAAFSNNGKAEEERREALEAIVKIEPELEGYNPEDLKVIDGKYVEYEDGHLLRLSDPSVKLLKSDYDSATGVVLGFFFIIIGTFLGVYSIKFIRDYGNE